MLKDRSSSAIVAVRDIEQARRFYGETLGLELADEGMKGVLVFKTGGTSLVVYPSDAAGTNKANAVVWGCADEFDAIAHKLKAKGIEFLHYPDAEGMQLSGDVHVAGGMKMVWFTDPDGNILHLNNA